MNKQPWKLAIQEINNPESQRENLKFRVNFQEEKIENRVDFGMLIILSVNLPGALILTNKLNILFSHLPEVPNFFYKYLLRVPFLI